MTAPTPITDAMTVWIEGHAIVPHWPSRGGRQEVVHALVARDLEHKLHFAMHPDPTLTGIAALRDAAFRHGMAATAELTRIEGENAALRTVMIAAAEEIGRCWQAHCDAEGYGPVNLMRRLEEGIPSEYGYSAGAFKKLDDETKALRAILERLLYDRDPHNQTTAASRDLTWNEAAALLARKGSAG